MKEGKKTKLAIIGGGYMAGIYSEKARLLGIETHCFSLLSGVKDASAFDYVHDINILDMDGVLSICQKERVDGVVATTEMTIAVASFVAEKMGLNGLPFEVATVITDKFRNRNAVEDVKDLCQPKFAEVFSVKDIIDLKLNYPIILKPTSKGGKRGVSVVFSEEEISEAFEYAIKDSHSSLPIIVEEFIEGDMECSVESLSFKGHNHIIQVTEKITSGAPHCVELAHHQPARISPLMRSKIEKVISDSLDSIGLKNGPCHTEIKIKGSDIYLIEFNARPGGDHIAHPLTLLSTGFDYIKESILVALGREPDFTSILRKPRYAGVIFVTEQTRQYKELFDICEQFEWCYKKNLVSDDLKTIIHNDGFNTNYFIYCADKEPAFLKGEL